MSLELSAIDLDGKHRMKKSLSTPLFHILFIYLLVVVGAVSTIFCAVFTALLAICRTFLSNSVKV